MDQTERLSWRWDPYAASTHLPGSRAVDRFTKQLQAFSELPEPPQEREHTARAPWGDGWNPGQT